MLGGDRHEAAGGDNSSAFVALDYSLCDRNGWACGRRPQWTGLWPGYAMDGPVADARNVGGTSIA